MSKVLLIGFSKKNNYGGGVILERNKQLLRDIFNDDILEFYTEDDAQRSSFDVIKDNIKLYTGLLNEKKVSQILDIIKYNNVKYVHIENSVFGRIAKKIKEKYPKVYVSTFFHNVEIDYIRQEAKLQKKQYLKIPAIKYNENMAMKYSDITIALNNRDSERLYELYGRQIDLISPASYVDKFNKSRCIEDITKEEIKILFIGSLFFANEHGISWFINNVMDKLDKKIKLIIVGKGMETKRSEYQRNNVEVVGSVEDISKYYYEADAVVAPIFLGSGMKTKTAEALMFGKTIIGTYEAFEGYNIEDTKEGYICNTENEFIEVLNKLANQENLSKYNKYSRELYEKEYSYNSTLNEWSKFLNKYKFD